MQGKLEVICGCMFSGKTSELIRRLDAAQRGGRHVVAFKHDVDRGGRPAEIASHAGACFPADAVGSSAELVSRVGPADVVGVDEAQFFDYDLAEGCARMVDHGKRVIVAGLDRTCFGDPFDPVPALCAEAGKVTHLTARCARCGAPAAFTQRLIAGADAAAVRETHPLWVGGVGVYEPRCEACFAPINHRKSSGGSGRSGSRCGR